MRRRRTADYRAIGQLIVSLWCVAVCAAFLFAAHLLGSALVTYLQDALR